MSSTIAELTSTQAVLPVSTVGTVTGPSGRVAAIGNARDPRPVAPIRSPRPVTARRARCFVRVTDATRRLRLVDTAPAGGGRARQTFLGSSRHAAEEAARRT